MNIKRNVLLNPAMQSVAQDLLKYHRALEVDSRLMPFKKIITLIDG